MNLGNVGRNVGFVALTAMSACQVGPESPSFGHRCDKYVQPMVDKALKQAGCSESETSKVDMSVFCKRVATKARIHALNACMSN